MTQLSVENPRAHNAWLLVVAVMCLLLPGVACKGKTNGKAEHYSVGRTGTMVIEQTFGADFDALSAERGRWDVWFEAVRPSEMYITPLRKTRIAMVSASEVSPVVCLNGKLAQKRIPLAELREGSHVCVISNEGRYADLRIDKIKQPTGRRREEAGALTVTYTIWDKK